MRALRGSALAGQGGVGGGRRRRRRRRWVMIPMHRYAATVQPAGRGRGAGKRGVGEGREAGQTGVGRGEQCLTDVVGWW
jgi:hypothetical protein